MRSMLTTALFALVALALPAASYAHSSGLSFEATSSPYIVDVGYEPVVLETGRVMRLEFELYKDGKTEFVDYDHVWVRITRDEDILLATGIARQSLGPTTLLYALERPGSYTLDVSYRSDERKDLASAEFPFEVMEGSAPYASSGGEGGMLVYAGAAALLLIAITSLVLWVRSRRGGVVSS